MAGSLGSFLGIEEIIGMICFLAYTSDTDNIR